ncbi:MAG: sigma-70 family RNA polymerase sigma factor [Candidatus Aminicenantes bacterium]|nr:sigma-70 family RNA polymerase sigma factor [Candidatus Aminicenantes bacterium]NIN24117.1 sigma-70 family RNA polymerase sigma factor [Candidatus Aminicenantes bacterium]NIN47823.1 sigma-70 family RNA polymerase sigma factor [Candidatus Aminicenantes bacterium]NIN90761.1 sigma-70 family RNA polymerase sigma factor [Candidatus Aminicenantes bacterium]NIO87448.1 sigma-70 family RNA polymerase sigma factor [Candidatus Aminicenantes bacterium]
MKELGREICYNNTVQENEQVLSDDNVVQSVRDGNTRNFEILINRYSKKIINFIHKMIIDYDEAQSLAQDVFLKVYETIKRYKMQDNFQAFIFTIAKNITLNYIKKQKRILWLSGQSNESGNNQFAEERYFRSEETQQDLLEKTQQEEMMTEALKSLKENQRIALIMKVYLDLSYNKIAEVTGWSVPKIETLISRAKSNLKEKVRLKEMGKTEILQENKKINVLKVNAR